MTTLNNDELLTDIRLMILGAAVNGDLTLKDLEECNIEHQHLTLGIPYLEALFSNFIATHDQQLLEAILAWAKPNPTTPAGENEFVPIEHIKSVFEGRK